MLSPEQLERIRSRASQPTFEATVQRLHADVSWSFQRAPTIPDRTAGYYHNFFCPDHAVQLQFNPDSAHRHRCPADGAWFSGEPYDSAWLWSVNYEQAQTCFRLALLWLLDSQVKHRDAAATILLGYAERYPDYQHPDPSLGALQGKVTYSMLDESVWVIFMAWASWLLRDQLSFSDSRTIREHLLIPAAEHLKEHRLNEVQNAENWVNAALATIGIVADRADLTDLALNGPFGFWNQVSRGILADGTWFEGTASYHFYSLAPMFWHARASEHTAIDLRQVPQLQAMLHAPLKWAYPDLTLPALNDCWYHSSLLDECGHGISPSAGFYEIGAGWYDEPIFGTLLRHIYRDRPRDSLEALLYGPEELPTDELPSRPSAHMAPSGVAVLRHWGVERGDDPYLLLKSGPHGGGHGHPDKLAIMLALNNHRLSPDLGTPGYGIGLNDTWYRQTISHNTVLLNQTSQPPACGRIRSFQAPEDGPFGVVDADVHWSDTNGPYDGAYLRRVILVGQGYFLDLFLIRRKTIGDVDWVYHNRGELMLESVMSRAHGNSGYAHLEDVQEGASHDATTCIFTGDGWGLVLAFAGGGATGIISAQGPDNPASETMPLVILRRRAQQTCFATVFHPYTSQPTVGDVVWYPSGDDSTAPFGCLVETGGTRDLWLFGADVDSRFPVPQRPVADQIFTYPIEPQLQIQ